MKKSYTYKQRKVWSMFCNKCKEFLTGNGSVILPYQCKCGKWEYDREFEWYVDKKIKEHYQSFPNIKVN